MSRQAFFIDPKFNKKLIYNSPINKYQEFTNAYVYSVMKKSIDDINDIIRNYITTPINLYDIQLMRYKRSVSIEKPNSSPSSIHSVDPLPEIPANSSAQAEQQIQFK
ncbi:hypothetical protein RhiirC2_773752 [Rhizophagus irregularis]|uniref:Uncharacterized protein n=1 Tax=Rhizophagus irregularis TaxID=588596 RepID=A0A2N1NN89_9GLOM|nr:hypothetical protein RhiirC2_773752 [Rhizophagus irregularis]